MEQDKRTRRLLRWLARAMDLAPDDLTYAALRDTRDRILAQLEQSEPVSVGPLVWAAMLESERQWESQRHPAA